MPNAVFDSTVLVSAFLTRRGVAVVLLRHAHEGAFSAFLSEEILAETQGVLLDDERRIRRRYHYPNESVHLFIEGLHDIGRVITDLPPVTVVARDPKDDIVTHGSPIFKAVQKKRDKALCRVLQKSPIAPECAAGGDAERSHIAPSVGLPSQASG